MSATGAAVPPAFQRLKPRTVRGATSSSEGAPSPWARRTVNTCVGSASLRRGRQGGRLRRRCRRARRAAAPAARGRRRARRRPSPARSARSPSRRCGRRRPSRRRGSARSAGPRSRLRQPARAAPATTCSTIIGARPSVGSSITSRRGSSSRARPIASICCSPPESCAPPCALALGEAREHRIDAVDLAPMLRDQAQRLVDRQRGPDAAALRHVGDAAARDLVRRAGRGSPRRPAGRCRVAGTSPVIALQSVVLPMPLRPTTAVHAALDREADALQRMGAAVVDVETVDDEHRARSTAPSRARVAVATGHQCLAPHVDRLHLGVVLDLGRAAGAAARGRCASP